MVEHKAQASPAARRGRRRFYVRSGIFIGLAAVAQASVALPPGPSNVALYWASLVIFVACAASVFLPAWEHLPRWVILVPTIGYLASVTLLLISGGTNPGVQSTAGGLSALVLLPVLAMALYYPSSYTAIVVGATVVSLTVVGIATQSSAATDLRRLFLWTAVAVVVAVTVHHLRRSLEGKVRDSAELARLGRLMNGATQSLTSLRDPRDVIAEGTLAMLELAGSRVPGRCLPARVRRRRDPGSRRRRPCLRRHQLPAQGRPLREDGHRIGCVPDHQGRADIHGRDVALGHRRDRHHATPLSFP